ncbi:prosaposin isoform X5 [Salvelinus alpinus]|uniref:prosaposin isoform X5 n=1 Tax=Salvelinus alpinus TaxID=8036 RepID=UPI0039FD1A70
MLCLALFFVSAAVATPLLGTEQCARGPPYWCQNVKTASICGAVVHCQQNVWNQPQMKSVPCDLCKGLLIAVDQLLNNNATQGEILDVLEKACHLIPDKSLAAECKDTVDKYYPILIGVIAGELKNPQVVCGAIGLCGSQQAALARLQAQIQSNQIPQLTSNEIPQEDLAQRVAPFLLNIPGLLYPQAKENTKQEVPKQEAGDLCEDCVKFITDFQDEAKRNTTFINSLIERIQSQCDLLGPGISDMQDVVRVLEKVCLVLPPSLSAQCKDLIESYGKVIIELLLQEADPKTICTAVGLCQDASRAFIPVLDQSQVVAGGSCDICKMAVRYIDGILEQNATQAQIEDAVRKVCSLVPEAVRGECNQLVEQYEPMLVQLLLQVLDPDFVCMRVGLCPEAVQSLLGMDQCSWGPAFWCKNMDSAKLCNAVAHCRRHVW